MKTISSDIDEFLSSYLFMRIRKVSFDFLIYFFFVQQNVKIVKTDSERLGMHIKGGLNGQRGNPADAADEGVFVSKINSSGAARRDGRLKVRPSTP